MQQSEMNTYISISNYDIKKDLSLSAMKCNEIKLSNWFGMPQIYLKRNRLVLKKEIDTA